MLILKEALDLLEDPSEFIFAVKSRGNDWSDVKFQDESGLSSPDRFFVVGHEFGASMLIHARSWEDAWEAWIDESPTIPEDEIIEAYGIVDDYREEYEKDHPPPGNTYTAIMSPEYSAWRAAFHAWCKDKLAELSEGDDPPNLIEGYEYQSNASGTGIVDVGHCAWMDEIGPECVRVRRKGEDE